MARKIKIEFTQSHYGRILIHTPTEQIYPSGNFNISECLISISESLWNEYADGNTIFFVSGLQLEKIKNYATR